MNEETLRLVELLCNLTLTLATIFLSFATIEAIEKDTRQMIVEVLTGKRLVKKFYGHRKCNCHHRHRK